MRATVESIVEFDPKLDSFTEQLKEMKAALSRVYLLYARYVLRVLVWVRVYCAIGSWAPSAFAHCLLHYYCVAATSSRACFEPFSANFRCMCIPNDSGHFRG